MREIFDCELEPTSSHTGTEVRGLMEIAFELAQREKAPAALLRVHVEQIERLAPDAARRTSVLAALLANIRALPRGGDLLACREGDDLVLLLPRTAPEAADVIARQSIDCARKLSLPGDAAARRASLSIGLAHAQSDLDLYCDTLLQVAEEGVAVARASGGETFVHTQLYELHQRKIERTRGPRPPVADARNGTEARNGAAHAGIASAPLPLPLGRDPEAAAAGARPVLQPLAPSSSAHAFAPGPRAVPAGDSLAEIEQRVPELSRDAASDALSEALKQESERHRAQIELLERRVEKLTRALAETEAELQRVASATPIDAGAPSAFRTVQGLDARESQYAMKLSLLTEILRANLELRAQLGGAAPAV
jgi:GGDEF domain-containing protein